MPKNINKIIRFKNDTRLLVTREGLSERCDICHQVDCFDPINNYCLRCTNIVAQLGNKQIIQYDFGNGIFEGTIVSSIISFTPIFFMLLIFSIFALPAPTFHVHELIWLFIYIPGLVITTGIISTYINTKYLKLASYEEILTTSRKFIDWITCVFIGATTGALAVTIIFILVALGITHKNILETSIMGATLGAFLGVINSSINSIVLMYKRNKAFTSSQ